MCSCHGEPMYWNADRRRTVGGYWNCSVRKKENARRNYPGVRDRKQAVSKQWYERQDGIWHAKRQLQQASQKRRMRLARSREECPVNPALQTYLAQVRGKGPKTLG